MEAFAALREEKCVGILQGKTTRHARLRNNVTVAQFRQNDFQGFTKSVQHSNRVFQRENLRGRRRCVGRLVHQERKLGLRILGMHQERRPPIYVTAQKSETFVCCVPRLHDDVIELIPQEILDHSFVPRLHLQKIREHTHRGEPALHHA